MAGEALSVMKAQMESIRFCTWWGGWSGCAIGEVEINAHECLNTKRLDGIRSHLARLTTRLSCSERLWSQEVLAGAVGAPEMFQSSRYWSRERPWPLVKAPTALTR